jgi:membrane-bound lytic murein transglycosylase A
MLQNSWLAWQQSCSKLQRRPAFSDMCAVTKNMSANIDAASIKSFFEKYFQPWKIEGTQSGSTGLITGYYEAFLSGGRQQAPNRVPLYAEPDDLLTVELGDLFPELKGKRVRARLQGKKVVPYWTRAEINQGLGPRADKVLVWADDTIAAFFLEVQGSGRVQLDDGSIIRLGYANQNGQPYRSIGRWLADQGEIPIEQVSMQRIQAWALANPDRLPELLAQNPSYVFFRIIPDNHLGPIGALNVPLTAEASIAVDPKFIPLGSPVWLDSTEPSSETPMQRLVHAQDTGGAIRGPVRADFYWGSGNEAGAKAGITKQKGQMWVLLPLSQLPPYSSAEKNPSDP